MSAGVVLLVLADTPNVQTSIFNIPDTYLFHIPWWCAWFRTSDNISILLSYIDFSHNWNRYTARLSSTPHQLHLEATTANYDEMAGIGLTENSFRSMEQSYQAILGPEVRQEAIEVQKAKRVLGFSALIFLIFTCGIFVLAGNSERGLVLKASSEAFLAGKCSPCTFIQCKADLCDAIQDPYQCTKGAALNGCSVKEETWSLSGVCDECCSAIDCAETIAAGDNDDKVAPCGDCTEDQCEALALVSTQMCYKSAPYVCVEGSSRMGCSADPYHWPAMAETQCRYEIVVTNFKTAISTTNVSSSLITNLLSFQRMLQPTRMRLKHFRRRSRIFSW